MTLRWEPDGEARGEVALLHGVMALAETWWRIGPALAARGWRVAAVDLPGHAGDVRRDGALDLDALVDGVAARLDGPVDLLVGHSLGAIVALGLLGARPGRRARGGARGAAGPGAPSTWARWRRSSCTTPRRCASTAPRSSRASARPTRAGTPATSSARCAASRRPTATRSSPRSTGPLRWDLSALLAGVDVPALVLAAPDAPGRFPLDPGSALRGADREAVRAALAPERFVEIEGGHCLHRDDAARWLEVVDGFAREALG